LAGRVLVENRRRIFKSNMIMGVQVKRSVNFIRWFSRFRWLIFSLVSLCIVVIGGWFTTSYLGNRASQEIIKDNESAISVLSTHLTGELKKVEGAVKSVSGSPGLFPVLVSRRDQDKVRANAILDRYNAAIGASVSYLIDRAGVTVASSNRNDADSFVGTSYRFRPYFIQAMQGHPGRYFGLGITSSRMGFYSSNPVRDSKGYIVGAVVMKKDLGEVERQLRSYPFCFFVDKHGIILLSSNEDMILKSLWPVNQKTQKRLIASKQFGKKPFEAVMSQEVVDGMNVALQGNHYLASRKVVDPEGWSIVLLTPTSRVMLYKSIGIIMTMLIGTLIMIPVVISYKAARSAEIVHESEERFRQVAQSSRDWIWEADGDGCYTYSSQGVKDILDYNPEDIVGKHISDFFVSVERDSLVPIFKGLFDKKDSFYRSVHRHTRRDGQEVFLESTGFPMVDHESNLVGYRGVHRDITARRVTEEALRRSEWKYRELVEKSNSIVLRRDHAGNVTFLNEYAQNFFGYHEEEIVGKNVVGTIVPEVESTGRNLRQMIEDIGLNPDRYVNNINENIRRNGERVWIAWTNKPVRDENGRVSSVLCIGNDITERKQAEELYRTLADSSHAGVYIVQEGKIQFVNPHIVEYTGYSKGEMLEKEPLDFVHPDDRKLMRSSAIDMLKGRRSTPYEFRIIDRRGNVKWVMETVRSIVYEGKRAVLGNTMDITERYQMERLLRQSQKMEAIGTLAGGIAHDFNNMLGAMVGYTEMAQLQSHSEKQKYYLDQVLCACDRAKDLVNQILAFSRQQEHEVKPVLLAPIVKEGIKLLRSSLPTTVQIEQGISDSSVAVLADPTQIHQVLVNLCTNAAHAMREKGGILSIGLDREDVDSSGRRHFLGLERGEYARLTVGDTGCGMDGFIVEKIFDPFFTTKGPGEGTGLGLSVVYGIVKNCGGVIDVSSELGKGTTFRVYLPLIEPSERVEEKVSAAVPGGDERILFVDDEAPLVEVGRMMLTSLGYRVTSRTSSVDALETFRVQPFDFDLVITDMTMPNMTGVDLAREVLKIRPDIPIILCTGFSEIISEEKAKGVGIRRFVMKPIFKMELAWVIREVLDT